MRSCQDIGKEFEGVVGLNEAKKIYKRLAKVLHQMRLKGSMGVLLLITNRR